MWIVAGIATALLDAIARDLRAHHVAIVAALSLAEAAILITIEPSMLPGADDILRHGNWLDDKG